MVNNDTFQVDYTTVADQTTQYPIPFLYFFNPVTGDPELWVSLNDSALEYQTDYTLSAAGLQLTFTPTAGLTLNIMRNPPFEQTTDFQTGIIDSEQIEASFDSSAMRDIYLKGYSDWIVNMANDTFGQLAPVAWTGSYSDLTDAPTDLVLLTGNQTIDGFKTFKKTIMLDGNVNGISSTTNGVTSTLLQRVSGFEYVGDTGLYLILRGSSPRLSYNSSTLAFQTDIPTVNDSTITFEQGGVVKGTITLNQSANATISLDAGGGGGTQVQSDWDQSDNTQVDYIKNKPTIPAAQIQSDWAQADNTKVDYIKNKPTNLVSTNTAQTISGLKTFSGDIALSGTTSIKNTTGGVNITLVYQDATGAHFGSSTVALKLHGTGTRPAFNGNDLALFSDVTGSTVPDQTGNSGKYLTTDGSALSWSAKDPLVNGTTSAGAVLIEGTAAGIYSVAIGKSASANNSNCVSIGYNANTVYGASSAVCVGQMSSANSKANAIGALATAFTLGTAIGYAAEASANGAIQIGTGTNSEAGTFKVSLGTTTAVADYTQYKLLESNGTIPAARLGALPVADGTYTLQLTISGGVPTLSWVAV